MNISKRFEEKAINFVDVGSPYLWGHFNDGVLMACDEERGKKRER